MTEESGGNSVAKIVIICVVLLFLLMVFIACAGLVASIAIPAVLQYQQSAAAALQPSIQTLPVELWEGVGRMMRLH